MWQMFIMATLPRLPMRLAMGPILPANRALAIRLPAIILEGIPALLFLVAN